MFNKPGEKVLAVSFFRTSTGNEPVKDWLKLRTKEDKKAIGEDIKAVEFLWPVGYPQVTKLDKNLWEVRTDLRDGICRIFFTVWKRYMVLLHRIIKKAKSRLNKIWNLPKSGVIWYKQEE